MPIEMIIEAGAKKAAKEIMNNFVINLGKGKKFRIVIPTVEYEVDEWWEYANEYK